MKKKACIIIGIVIAFVLVFEMLPAKIDCGKSEIYTTQEREAAADIVVHKIKSFEGCKLFLVKYDGDTASQKNLVYCNSLVKKNIQYVDCIVFTSYFRSPVFGGGAWNANDIYSWSWYLARTTNGEWEIISYGYA